MTNTTDLTARANEFHDVWSRRVKQLISYRYLGCSSTAIDRDHAEGRMCLRSDMRTPGGLRAAPLAIAVLDTAGINVDGINQLALTQIDVHLLDAGVDVSAVRLCGRVVREARSQIFTEARIEDAEDPGRVVAYGTADWAIMSPTPPGFSYVDPGSGVPDSPSLPPLVEAFGARARRGGGFEIEALSPRVGAKFLHHGPIQVSLEATALEVAAEHAGTEALRMEHLGTRIVRGGRTGPFTTRAEILPTSGDTIACRAEMRDQGAADGVVAVAIARMVAVG